MENYNLKLKNNSPFMFYFLFVYYTYIKFFKDMNEVLNTNNIIVDYNDETNEFRISLFDKHGHYIDEYYMSSCQMRDLIQEGKNIKILCDEDEF